MDSNTLISLSAFAVIIAVVLFYFNLRIKGREKKAFRFIDAFAQAHNNTITKFDFSKSTYVGIGYTTSTMIFFIRKFNDIERRTAINLADVSQCRLVKSYDKSNSSKDNSGYITKIGLVLTHRNPAEQDAFLEFYNIDYDPLTLSGELQLAEKWREIIQEEIRMEEKKKSKTGSNKQTKPVTLPKGKQLAPEV